MANDQQPAQQEKPQQQKPPEEVGIVRARTSAQFEHDGRKVRIIKGKTTVEIGASILKGRAHLFEPLIVDFPRHGGGRGAA
jgi:hypothetical protein